MKPNKSSKDWSFRIKDISYAIEKIEKYTHGLNVTQFKKNELIIDAVIRNLEIIGEASNSIPSATQHEYHHIPWRQMIAMRNFVIHEIIWQTIQKELPALKKQLEPLITLLDSKKSS